MGENISLLIGGTAGQGVQTIGNLLARICSAGGFFTHGYDSYQSRIRGGHNFHLLRVGERAIDALCPVPDIVVAMDENTMDIHGKTLSSEGIAILNGTGENKENFYFVPLARLAAEAGDPVCMNTVAAGVVSAVLGADLVLGSRVVEAVFGPRGNETVSLNKEALRRGFLAGKDLGADFSLAFSSGAHARPLVSGAKAAALGALAADCRFFPFYPMSPGTPVLTQLANYVHDFPIVLEQAEDELAAVNMAIGASCAGVRSLVSTSGGGFSLMGEG
ncbi:MAG: 2-oxoacid:acceptor oxidoreductase family protein, partial [Desulfovibrionales bacterium]|nr:2-oxoacid:acceptor oxidoreductase family protein [Desulfovibrionales bacterium]